MPDRNGYIPGVPCWVDTMHADPSTATEFYEGLFGWETENALPPGSPGEYHLARIRGRVVAGIGSQPESAPPDAMWNTYIWVDSADEAAARAQEAGGQVVAEPFDVMDAGRMAVLADPEGATICVWQAGDNRGAEVVNEHGALVFNGLNTRDPEAAKAFYGSVFGWRTLNPDSGEMWTVPGYGDHLEEIQPGTREAFAEGGAPAGFEDVIAMINPIGEDDPDTPAHWSVTFSVDDADVAAERAAELGGSVLAPPFDAPWVRMTVLADPEGATFIASKFVPENRELGAAG